MYEISLNVECNRWLYRSGAIVKSSSIHFQVHDEKGFMKAIKTFENVTPAQAARAVALQNKLGRIK